MMRRTKRPLGLLAVMALIVAGRASCRANTANLRAVTMADPPWCDEDQDGFCYQPFGLDCDDGNPNTHPGAIERPDLKDNDCDGFGDEPPVGFVREGYSMQGFASAVAWYGEQVYLAAAAVLQVYSAPPDATPRLVHEIELRDWVREMVVAGDTLFVAARGDGLLAFSLAEDPVHPRLVGRVSGLFDAGGYAGIEAVFNGLDAKANTVAVARANDVRQAQGGVDAVVFDYDPASGWFTATHVFGAEIRANTAFEIPISVGLTDDAKGLYVGYGVLPGELVYVPLDTPDDPVLHGDVGAVMDIATLGDVAFVAITDLDWPTVDCTQLSRVRIVGGELVAEPLLTNPGSSAGNAVAIHDDLLCFGTWSPGRYEEGHNLWTFTDLLADAPTRLGAAGTLDWIFQLACRNSAAGSAWVYVADEWGGLEVWQSDGSQLTLDLDRHRVATGMLSKAMWTTGNRVYSAKEGAGLWFFDTLQPQDECIAVEWIDRTDPGCNCQDCCPPEEGAWPYPPAVFVSAGASNQGRVALIAQDRNTAVPGDAYFMLFEEEPSSGEYEGLYSEPLPPSLTASWTEDTVVADGEILFVSSSAMHKLRLYQHCPDGAEQVRFLADISMPSDENNLEIADVAVYGDYLFVAEVHHPLLAVPDRGMIHAYRWKDSSLATCPAQPTLLDPAEYLGSFAADWIPYSLLVDPNHNRLIVGCSSKPTFPVKEGALLFYGLGAFNPGNPVGMDDHWENVSPGLSVRVTSPNIYGLLLDGTELYVADVDNGLYVYAFDREAYVAFYPAHRGDLSQAYQPQLVQSPLDVVPLQHPIAVARTSSGKVVVQEGVPGRISILSRRHPAYLPIVVVQP